MWSSSCAPLFYLVFFNVNLQTRFINSVILIPPLNHSPSDKQRDGSNLHSNLVLFFMHKNMIEAPHCPYEITQTFKAAHHACQDLECDPHYNHTIDLVQRMSLDSNINMYCHLAHFRVLHQDRAKHIQIILHPFHQTFSLHQMSLR